MIASIRQKFNAAFTEEVYQNYLAALNTPFPGALDFSVAETPIFIDKVFIQKVLSTGDYVNQVIQSDRFNSITEPSLKNIPHFHNWPCCKNSLFLCNVSKYLIFIYIGHFRMIFSDQKL